MAKESVDLASLWLTATGSDPREALAGIAALRSHLAALERDHVSSLLREGAGWAEVGRALGISRQAAHRRFRNLLRAGTPRPQERVVVEGRARGVVRLARAEAERSGAAAVGTEHLLIALLVAGHRPAADALHACGVDAAQLRSALAPTIVDDGVVEAGGFTALARQVLEGSLSEALERGERHIAVEHLLLALLRQPDGGAAQTLHALGLSADQVRGKLEVLAPPPPASHRAARGETPA